MPSPSSLDLFYGTNTLAGQQARAVCFTTSLLSENERLPVVTYLDERRSLGISGRRLSKIAFTLVSFRRYLDVEYLDCVLLDYRKAIANLYELGSFNTKKPFSQQTIADFVRITKQFFSWMVENEIGLLTEADLKKIRVPPKGENYLTHADILTPEEVLSFINACKTPRDRALFSMLYEGGFRIGEIGTLTWGDLKFDNYGILVSVIFKTGKPRTIRLLACVRDVSIWRSVTQSGTGPSDLVFTQLKISEHTHITYGLVKKAMERIAKEAKITKKIYPHLFRHSRITHMLSDGIHESVIKLVMWGDIGSEQLKTYAHLSTANIDAALFDCYGIKTQQAEKPVTYAPVTCSHCRQINPPGSGYCSACGQALSDSEISSSDALQEYLNQHPELIIEFLSNRVKSQNQIL
jgi:integrase